MNITFQLPLQQVERQKLADVIGCPEANLDQSFAPFAKAATDEYVQMFLGKNAFRRTVDFQDFRILLLIIHVLNGKIPDEALISRLFQTSGNESRARIKSVLAKYQRILEQQIKGSITDILNGATLGANNTHVISINNHTVVDMLNAKLAEIDGNHTQVSKVRGTVCSYSLENASYVDLVAAYA